MKKIIIGVVILAVIVGVGYFVFSNKNGGSSVAPDSAVETVLTSPERPAEINGYILSVQGNELIVANEVGKQELTDEERAARQNMSPEERQALKAQETANLTKENVTIIIPVGTPIAKGSGDGAGTNVKAEIAELTKGAYVSIWKTSDQIEFVKLKGLSQ